MHARFPIPGVCYPSETELIKAFNCGHALERTIGDVLHQRATSFPEKIFLISEGAQISYADFDKRTDRLAASLIDLGLRPGQRAIFQMGTTIETLVALFSCYKCGVIPVCTLPQHREHEISTMIQLTEAKAYFVDSSLPGTFDLLGFASSMVDKHDCVQFLISSAGPGPSLSDLSQREESPEARHFLKQHRPDARDVLTFQLSGGSTGIPKIIPRFHGEYLGQANSMVRRHEISETDVAIWPLPVIHNAAMILAVLPTLMAGATLVLRRRYDRNDFLAAIENYKVTYAGSIGPIAQSILDDQTVQARDLSSMRLFFVLDRADAIQHHLQIPTTNLYGITEGLLMTGGPNDDETIRFESTGYPTGLGDRVKVVTLGGEEEVSEGSDGELCFASPHMIRGYYNAPELSEDAFTKDGYFRTGDIVRAKKAGGTTVYEFLGRSKDNINRGGEKFAAGEVERFVVKHPSILDAKVVPMPDRLLGEKACAFLIVENNHTCPSVQKLSRFLAEAGLARFKHPERIEIIDTFPVTKVGKVDKMRMREVIANRIASEWTQGMSNLAEQT